MCKMSKRENYSFYVNPITPGVHKMVNYTSKILKKCCKIFNMCLTIFWTPGIIGLMPVFLFVFLLKTHLLTTFI